MPADWDTFLTKKTAQYRKFYVGWLREFCRGQCYILRYEALQVSLGPQLDGLTRFLTGHDLPLTTMDCIRHNSEGNYHRGDPRQAPLQPVSRRWAVELTGLRREVMGEVAACVARGHCVDGPPGRDPGSGET